MGTIKRAFRTVSRKLKQIKEELEKESVANSNTKHISCCNPPEELFEKSRKKK